MLYPVGTSRFLPNKVFIKALTNGNYYNIWKERSWPGPSPIAVFWVWDSEADPKLFLEWSLDSEDEIGRLLLEPSQEPSSRKTASPTATKRVPQINTDVQRRMMRNVRVTATYNRCSGDHCTKPVEIHRFIDHGNKLEIWICIFPNPRATFRVRHSDWSAISNVCNKILHGSAVQPVSECITHFNRKLSGQYT